METKLDVVVPVAAVDRFEYFCAEHTRFNVDACSKTTSASSGSPHPTGNSLSIQQKRAG